VARSGGLGAPQRALDAALTNRARPAGRSPLPVVRRLLVRMDVGAGRADVNDGIGHFGHIVQ
jgi:hypothetical protein